MTKRRSGLFLALLLVFGLLGACSRSNDSNSPESAHPMGKDWLIEGSDFHGAQYENKSLNCSSCHDLATFCYQCHYGPTGTKQPPTVSESAWNHGSAATGHAAEDLFTAGQKTVCTTCHGIENRYTGQPLFTDCTTSTCHPQVPNYHGPDFFDAHPPKAKANIASCSPCHNTPAATPNFDGYVTGVACRACHNDGIAHPPGPAGAPDWYVDHRTAGNRPAACAICHNVSSAGDGPLPGAPSCFSSIFDSRGCHPSGPGTAPHPMGQAWLDPTKSTYHGANMAAYDCNACHQPLDVFCSQCHFGPTGTKQPATVSPSVWNHGNALFSHASKDLLLPAQQTVCTTCHALLNGYSNEPKFTDCTTATCHPQVPNYHGPAPAFFGQHPAQAKANIGSCAPCHNTPPPAAPNFNGFVTGVACVACHDQGVAHPPGPAGAPDWYIDHRSSGNQSTSCSLCHNITSTTGPGPLPAAPGCFGVSSFEGRGCHVDGPGSAPHPVPFTDPLLHGPAAKGNPGLVYCQQCHAAPASGRDPAPRFNVTIGSLTKGCETCHAAETAHPSTKIGDVGLTPWYGATWTHKNAQNLTVSCALCHGAALQGDVGPACTACHFSSPVTNQNCTSCHASPPNSTTPTSNATNRAGAHAAHNALAGVTGVCATCHKGGGTGTSVHYNAQKVPVMAFTNYNAKTGGPASFTITNSAGANDGTCSGVSCHGGKTTPNWLTGRIDVSTDAGCVSCHAFGTSQYNSYSSGEHDEHVNGEARVGCTQCHNTAALPVNHFTHLDTPQMEGPASATVGGTEDLSTYSGGRCTTSCHGSRTW